MHLPVRQPARRATRGATRRRSRLLTAWRAAGAALAVTAIGGLLWLTTSDTFAIDADDVALSGVRYTDSQVLRALIGPALDGRPSIFSLRTAELEAALLDLPAVAEADVVAVLPDRLAVVVTERVPVFVLRAGGMDFLVDADGVLLSAAPSDDGAVAELPVVEDLRSLPAAPAVGDVLQPVDLAAMLKLAAVDPPLLRSTAQTLALTIEDQDGYVLSAEPVGWRAVFGHYTPTLRPPDIIDRQVQCLRAVLGEYRERLAVVYLSPADERCGTFREAATPMPAGPPPDGIPPASPAPTRP